MPESLLAQLLAAKDPEEKAAIVAESYFSDLSPATALIARRCIILRWWDEAVIAALLGERMASVADSIYNELAALPFVENLPWGQAYHEMTRAGLLKRYGETQPQLLQEAAGLAAPAYLRPPEEESRAAEALYAYTVAGITAEAKSLLEKLLLQAGRRQDWQTVGGFLQTVEEAESLPFVQSTPKSALYYLFRGLARKAQGDLAGAIQDYNRAIELNPQYAAAYNNRGIARSDQGILAGAIQDYNRAIELNPQYAAAYNNRGIARKAQGDLAGAIQDYTRAIELDPQDATTYNNRGLARKDQGDLAGAIQDYTRAIELDPQDAAAYNNRGNARADQGDLAGAIQDYTRAIELDPQLAMAYSNLGTVLRQQGKWNQAQAAYQKALELQPTSFIDWAALADIARRSGDEATWRNAIEKARTYLDETDVYDVACFESIAGNVDKALALLAKEVEAKPGLKIWAQQDPDLAWIRDDPRFWEIVGPQSATEQD